MIGVAVFAAMMVLLCGYALALYRGLRRARRRLTRAWFHLEFAWTRRDGEITRILELCREDAACESEPLERVERARAALQEARNRHDVAAVNGAEEVLRTALASLYPIAARHPHPQVELMLHALRFRIRAHERAIAAERERYNEAARALNARVELLPDSLIAGVCHCTATPLLEFGITSGTDSDLGLAFSK